MKRKIKSKPGCLTAFLLVLAAVFLAGFIYSSFPHEHTKASSDYGNIFVSLLVIALIIFLVLRVLYHRNEKIGHIDSINWNYINKALSEIGSSIGILSSIDIMCGSQTTQATVFMGSRMRQVQGFWHYERPFAVSDRTFLINYKGINCSIPPSQRNISMGVTALTNYNCSIIFNADGKGIISVNTTIPDYVEKNNALKHLSSTDKGVLAVMSAWK